MSGSPLRASLVLIVLMFMVAGGLACGSDAPLTPAGTTDVDAVTPAATQAPMPIATATAVPTATATNTPVPTATATPVVPDGKSRTAPIPRGQSVTHDDFKLTITDVSYSTAGEGFFAELEEGHVWAYVSLRIESTGDPDKTYSYNTINFRMVGSRGVIYDDWVSTPRGDLGSGEVFGGGVVEGTVIRQVHKDDTDLVLIYSPTFRGSVYLALGTAPNDGISMGVVMSDSPMATATNTPAPMATAAPTATNTPAPMTTAAPTATNTPIPTATATPVVPDGKSRTAPIPRGQSVTHDDFKLTITDVSYSTAGEGFFAELEEGHVWAYVSLRIESTGDPDKTYSYNTINFRMVGSRGVIYDDWVSTPRGDLGSGEVFGGGVVEGTVIRQVHKDDTDLVLIYSPTFRGSVYLALGTAPNDGISMGVVMSDSPMATATNTPAPMATAAPTATNTPAPMTTAAPTATNTPIPTATATPTPTNTPIPKPWTQFGDGTWIAGADIVPGVYSAPGGSGCYWERLSGFSGGFGDIIANDSSSGERQIVTSDASDAGFSTNDCGEWIPLSESFTPTTTLTDGTWVVGDEVDPGVYSAPGGSGCYWERLSGFSGEFGDIIANDSSSGGRQIVAIDASDAGFSTNNCGEWTQTAKP